MPATNLSLRTRIVFAAVSTLLTVAAYLFITLYSQERLDHITHEILDIRINTMRAAATAKQSLTSYDNNLFRYLATRDKSQLYERDKLKNNVSSQINILLNLSTSHVIQSRLKLLQAEIEKYFIDAERLLKFFQRTKLPENAGIFQTISWQRSQNLQRQELSLLSAEGRTRLARIFSLADELVTFNRVELEKARHEMNQLFQQSRQTAWTTGGIVGGIILLISVGLAFSLTAPLRLFLEGVQHIEQGNLNFEIPIRQSDEVGQLTHAFNRMTQRIREQHDRLLHETITDGLTGIHNQRHFRYLLKQELDRARRSGQPLCLLMLDLDHFKKYNDTQGHELGNEVLKSVCNTIKEGLRDFDSLARYGGDELSVILPNTTIAEAKIISGRLLEAVSKSRFPGQEKSLNGHISLSIGGACFPENAPSSNDLIGKADEALYAAKQNGRDRICWAA